MAYKPEDREQQQQVVESLQREVQENGSRVEQLAALSQLSVARALLLLCSQREQPATA